MRGHLEGKERRTMRFARWTWPLAVLLAATTTTTAAHADDKVVCANASENGQKLRDDGKLMKARQEFMVCSRDVCPGVIKKDCVDWLAQAEASLPSVVLAAKDEKGQDVTNVHVSFDGAPLSDRLDGKAIFVDPGEHTFRFESAGRAPIEQQAVIREGERNRVVAASWEAAPAPLPPAGGGTGVGTAPPPEQPHGKSKVPAILVGGIGIAALATGGVFLLLASNDFNDLKDTCGKTKTCTDDQVSPVKTKALIGDIALGVGAVAVVGAVVLYITESGSSSASATVGKNDGKAETPKKKPHPFALNKVDVAPTPGGAALMLGGSF